LLKWKVLSTTKSSFSTITTINLTKPQTSQTITIEEPNLSSPFLEKEKKVPKLMAKLLYKQTIPNPVVKSVSFDICDPLLAKYQRIIELTYRKLKNLSHIFYSGG